MLSDKDELNLEKGKHKSLRFVKIALQVEKTKTAGFIATSRALKPNLSVASCDRAWPDFNKATAMALVRIACS